MIYQEEKITNGELSIAFAKGVSFQFGTEEHASKKLVAWAIFAKVAMKMSAKIGEDKEDMVINKHHMRQTKQGIINRV